MKKLTYQNLTHLPNMSRRGFLHASLGITLALTSGNIYAINGGLFKQSPEDKLLSILNNQSSISVGQLILKESNLDLPAPKLLTSILSNLNLSLDTLTLITKKELSTRLQQQTTNDFDSGHIVNVSGWVIGLTEAKLCMLAANRSLSFQ